MWNFVLHLVLNLIINGLPSKQNESSAKSNYNNVLNLIINGLPSKLNSKKAAKRAAKKRF